MGSQKHHCALAQLRVQEQLAMDEGVVKVSCDERMGTTLCKLHVSVLEQWPQNGIMEAGH